MRQWKNYQNWSTFAKVIVKIKNSTFLWTTVYLIRGRGTYTAGTEKRLFLDPLMMTWCAQNARNCTYLHLYFEKKISGGKTGEWLSPLPRFLPWTNAMHRPTFSELPRSLYLIQSTERHTLSSLSSETASIRLTLIQTKYQIAVQCHPRSLISVVGTMHLPVSDQ